MNHPTLNGENLTTLPQTGSLTIFMGSREVMVFTADGRLLPGAGLSTDEVTTGVFAALRASLPKAFKDSACAEIEKLKERVEQLEDESRAAIAEIEMLKERSSRIED